MLKLLHRTNRKALLAVVAGASLCALAGDARAQAWVDDPGSLSASFDYTYGKSNNIVGSDGEEIGDFPITNHSFLLGLEYAPLEDLGVTLSLPILGLNYGGDQGLMHPIDPHGDYDDGDTHFTPQDLRAGVRYQLFGPFAAVSPHLAVTVPVAGYETQGYAGAGRHLKRAHVGLSAGAILSPWVPRLFVHGRYEFTLAEKYDDVDEPTAGYTADPADADITSEVGQNASDLNLQVGYFVLDPLEIHASFDAHWQHGGISFEEAYANPVLTEWHDPLLNESYMVAGGGASYAVRDDLRLTAFFRLYLRGKNSRDVTALGGGISYDIL